MLLETEILNDAQLAAVRQADGPVLIFAGAGSGKTRVLTHRIGHLLGELRIAPERILAVTFTNKAAGEMKSRLHAMVGPVARDIWVGTFHSMCVRILRRDGSRIGIGSSFAVIDESDQRQLVKEILDDLDYDERQLSASACLATATWMCVGGSAEPQGCSAQQLAYASCFLAAFDGGFPFD